MPPRTDPWRDRPSAGQSGNVSAVFAFATEPPQQAQPTLPRNGATVGSSVASVVPQLEPSIQSSATSRPTSSQNAESAPPTTGTVEDELDQLENEVIHFMNMSMEEKEKSELLSERLESVTQEKKDIERQIDELDQDLSRSGWSGEENDPSSAEAGDTMSRVKTKITSLRASALKLETDFNTLAVISDQRTKTIAVLEEQLRNMREQLAQKIREEERLRKELERTQETARSEKKNNDEMRSSMNTLGQQCNELRALNARTNQRLAESEQTKGTLTALAKRKVAELRTVKKTGAAQAETMRQELDRKQKEIESLLATQKDLVARCEKSQADSLQQSQTISRLQSQLLSQSQPQPVSPQQPEWLSQQQPGYKLIKDLTEKLQRNQQRRTRAVAIGIDLSGSAAGSLTDGIKRLYAHLLETLQGSPCQTYVMTVIHGPGDTATVKSNFGDTWEVHGKVLEGQKADGMEQHVECLRKIKEVTVNMGLVLDLQIVLIGDCHTNKSSHVGAEEVCRDFDMSRPRVHIHSVSVKTGSTEETAKYWNGLEQWTPWNYVSATRGNMKVWRQNETLPDLGDFVY